MMNDDEDEEVTYFNHYRCINCGTHWTETWTCMCSDKCPGCNREIEPYKSEEL